MGKNKVENIRQDTRDLVVIILGKQNCKYSGDKEGCMIEAWDINQAVNIFKLNTPAKKRKKH